jgi:hypothetical protein
MHLKLIYRSARKNSFSWWWTVLIDPICWPAETREREREERKKWKKEKKKEGKNKKYYFNDIGKGFRKFIMVCI